MENIDNKLAQMDARIVLAARRLQNIDHRIVAFGIIEDDVIQLGEVTYVSVVTEEVKALQRVSLEDAVARIPHGPLTPGSYEVAALVDPNI